LKRFVLERPLPEEMVIPGETPKTMSPRLYVPKYQIAMKQRDFPYVSEW
jgi:hypothetical protein